MVHCQMRLPGPMPRVALRMPSLTARRVSSLIAAPCRSAWMTAALMYCLAEAYLHFLRAAASAMTVSGPKGIRDMPMQRSRRRLERWTLATDFHEVLAYMPVFNTAIASAFSLSVKRVPLGGSLPRALGSRSGQSGLMGGNAERSPTSGKGPPSVCFRLGAERRTPGTPCCRNDDALPPFPYCLKGRAKRRKGIVLDKQGRARCDTEAVCSCKSYHALKEPCKAREST